jgi:hypothetical protein
MDTPVQLDTSVEHKLTRQRNKLGACMLHIFISLPGNDKKKKKNNVFTSFIRCCNFLDWNDKSKDIQL